MNAVLPTPAERLTLSRERLRLAMCEISAPPGATSRARASGAGPAWLDSLESIPAAGIVIDAVRSWWAQHPWRVVGVLAGEAVKTLVQPMAQRHPLGLVLGALLFGGVLAWTRPWRLIVTSSLFAGLLPQLLSKAAAEVPTQSWLAMLTAWLQQPSQPKKPV